MIKSCVAAIFKTINVGALHLNIIWKYHFYHNFGALHLNIKLIVF